MAEICRACEPQRSRGVQVGEGEMVVFGGAELLTSLPIVHLFPFPALCLLSLSQGGGVGEAHTIQWLIRPTSPRVVIGHPGWRYLGASYKC